MNYITYFFLTICFVTNLYPQKTTVKTLYDSRQYEIVIDSLIKKSETKKLNFEEYYMLTRSFGRTRQYSNGLIFAKEMQDLALKKKDTINIIKAANLAAENFVDLNEIQEGLRYSIGMTPFFRKKDSIEYQKFCFKLGMLLYYNKEYDKAYKTYNQITKPEYRSLNLFQANYALILGKLKKNDEAVFHYKKGLQKVYKREYHEGVCNNLTNIGAIYIDKRDWNNAAKYLDSAKRHSQKNKVSVELKSRIEQHYFNLYQQQNKTLKAHATLNKLHTLNQQLVKERLLEEIQALETSNKRELILKQKVKITDNRLENSQRQKLWGAVIFLFIIIGLISTIFLYKYKSIKASNEHILTEQRLLRLQMNPHFIFNSLSILQGMILNKEDLKAVTYVSKFSKLLRVILESSREKMISIEQELNTLEQYINLQNIGRSSYIKYTLSIDENIRGKTIYTPPMLIQPFIENAIEHGFVNNVLDPEITISVTFINEELKCVIKDNGIGIGANKSKFSENKKSLATIITSERLNIISKLYKVNSSLVIQDRNKKNEQGTEVVLTLPYKLS